MAGVEEAKVHRFFREQPCRLLAPHPQWDQGLEDSASLHVVQEVLENVAVIGLEQWIGVLVALRVTTTAPSPCIHDEKANGPIFGLRSEVGRRLALPGAHFDKDALRVITYRQIVDSLEVEPTLNVRVEHAQTLLGS